MRIKPDLRKDTVMRNQLGRNSKSRRRSRPILGYEIRVKGHLETTALEWFGEIWVANLEDGDALISGSIPDQSALMRVLLHLHDLGLTILSVKALQGRRLK